MHYRLSHLLACPHLPHVYYTESNPDLPKSKTGKIRQSIPNGKSASRCRRCYLIANASGQAVPYGETTALYCPVTKKAAISTNIFLCVMDTSGTAGFGLQYERPSPFLRRTFLSHACTHFYLFPNWANHVVEAPAWHTVYLNVSSLPTTCFSFHPFLTSSTPVADVDFVGL
jgi:hypothetical protein